MMSRCYDDGVRVDEEMYPALNDESNPVLKNKKVSRIRVQAVTVNQCWTTFCQAVHCADLGS